MCGAAGTYKTNRGRAAKNQLVGAYGCGVGGVQVGDAVGKPGGVGGVGVAVWVGAGVAVTLGEA